VETVNTFQHNSSAPVFVALADSTRRELLVYLAENSPKTATQLSVNFPITRQGIHKHLNILEQAGLVSVEQHGRDKRYSLTPEPLEMLEEWVRELGIKWDNRLLRLKVMLERESKQ
jgi:DNA-binding transcriptional ArsR family regulator